MAFISSHERFLDTKFGSRDQILEEKMDRSPLTSLINWSAVMLIITSIGGTSIPDETKIFSWLK